MNTDGLYTNFAEFSVAAKPGVKSRLYKVLLITAALSAVIALMLFIGIFAKPFMGLIPVLGVMAVFFIWFFWKYTNREYEYLIAGGEMRMTVIYGGRKRKELFCVRVSSMSVIVSYNGQEIPEAAGAKRFFCVSSPDAKEIVCAVFVNEKKQKNAVYFEPTKKALSLLKFYNSSAYRIKA